jgi:hypothetical protein
MMNGGENTDDEQAGGARVDLTQFSSPQHAVTTIERERGFDDVAFPFVQRTRVETLLTLFFRSATARARGLHEGIVRETKASNPHAAFPLIRQLAECVAVTQYVVDDPDYVRAIMRDPRHRKPGQPKRKNMQAFVNYMNKHHADQFGLVYRELSDLTHFGSTAMWTSHAIMDEENRLAIWVSEPHWRDETQLYIACAWTVEVSALMEDALRNLGVACLNEQETFAGATEDDVYGPEGSEPNL